MLWLQDAGLKLPAMRRNAQVCRMEWRPAAYHTVLQTLRHPVYAGAYVFGRTANRTRIVEGRARKTTGHSKSRAAWNVLLRDHHRGYITWEQFEANQQLISENAHMQKRTEWKSARGSRALLTGLIRCGRCGRTMRVFYGSRSGHSHRYQSRGDDSHVGGWLCIGIGGLRVDRAVVAQIVDAVSDRAVEAAIRAAGHVARADDDKRWTSPVEVIRTLGGQWADREVATTMNRMRCKPADGKAWTTVRVRELRERLGIKPFDPAASQGRDGQRRRDRRAARHLRRLGPEAHP